MVLLPMTDLTDEAACAEQAYIVMHGNDKILSEFEIIQSETINEFA